MSLIVDPNAPEQAGPSTADLIKDTSSMTFMDDVVQASQEVPVVVDFWAPGCQPCDVLKPILEKLVLAAGGAIKLVKVNAQECQDIAMQLQVQSVPTVFVFKDGRPVDAFQGALPESDLRKFLEKHMGEGGSPIQQALEQANEMLETGQTTEAMQVFMQIQQHDQGNPEAIAGIMRCHLALDDVESAKEIASQLPDDFKKNSHIASAIAAIDLAGQGDVDTSALDARLSADENDHEARFELAMALYGAGRTEEALNHLLEIVKKDRTWKEDGAREQMLKIFEAIGLSDPVVLKARRKLTTVLFS